MSRDPLVLPPATTRHVVIRDEAELRERLEAWQGADAVVVDPAVLALLVDRLDAAREAHARVAARAETMTSWVVGLVDVARTAGVAVDGLSGADVAAKTAEAITKDRLLLDTFMHCWGLR